VQVPRERLVHVRRDLGLRLRSRVDEHVRRRAETTAVSQQTTTTLRVTDTSAVPRRPPAVYPDRSGASSNRWAGRSDLDVGVTRD
jgi:hypothetical protein